MPYFNRLLEDRNLPGRVKYEDMRDAIPKMSMHGKRADLQLLE
jgi:hypothetical protein